jgi:aspartyl/glutamyl-tRNA(Asn/Gln) amidotransferase C subunit
MINIKELADLAKLDLNKEELALYSQQMPDIIKFVDTLLEVEINDDFEFQSYNQNVWRQDEVLSWDKEERKAALEQGPLESGFVISPKIR